MALIACVLWIAGFEVLPWMHLATHGHVGAHHHGENGETIFDAGPADHHHHDDDDHDAEVDEHGVRHDDMDAEIDEHAHDAELAHAAAHHHDDDDETPHDDAETRLAEALGHGRHSLAHHDIAITTPPPFLTSPLPVDRRPTFLLEQTSIDPISFSPGRAVARGPPARSPHEVI
jgi:hypothetical protein